MKFRGNKERNVYGFLRGNSLTIPDTMLYHYFIQSESPYLRMTRGLI